MELPEIQKDKEAKKCPRINQYNTDFLMDKIGEAAKRRRFKVLIISLSETIPFFLLSFTANTTNHMYVYHIDITMNTSSTIYITIPSILSPPAKDLSQ